jgi:hypothetical protein
MTKAQWARRLVGPWFLALFYSPILGTLSFEADAEIVQEAYLKASNTRKYDSFGTSVAISGNTLVVGASYERSGATGVNGNQFDHSVTNWGAAYVFVRESHAWKQQAFLKSLSPGLEQSFGNSVAISGDTIVVGAPTLNGGRAYVYTRNGTTWTGPAVFESATEFGRSVDISGDTMVVSAYPQARVYARDAAGWSQQATVWWPGAWWEKRRDVVAISGDTLLFQRWVFVRTGTTWDYQAGLDWGDSSDLGGGAISGETAAVAAVNYGAVYIFVRKEGKWTPQARLRGHNTSDKFTAFGQEEDYFGRSLSLSGDWLIVGAPLEASRASGVDGDGGDDSAPGRGAAYLFRRDGTNWSQVAYLKPSNDGDGFGTSVAVSGNSAVVGAPSESSAATGVNGDQENHHAYLSGAGYVFAEVGDRARLSVSRSTYGGYHVYLHGSAGTTYQFQRAPRVKGPWEILATLTAPASGVIDYWQPSAPPEGAFYRAVEP